MRILAGPCQHETLEQSSEIAKECKRVCEKYNITYYFKASFDKANRTSDNGVRGVGLERSMLDFKTIKDCHGIPIITDVHSAYQVENIEYEYGDAVDVYQIPAKGILTKTETAKQIWITERGTSFGYNNLVVDFNGIQYMINKLGVPIIFDATHSCQQPGGLGHATGGNRSNIAGLTRAASALGVTNFFLEVHSDPDNAPSDGDNMLRLEDFERTVDDIHRYSYSS